MTFTFCSFTYNQRELIARQLESYKHQIDEYGEEVECHYILADDNSSDGTPEIVEAWLEQNPNLFSTVKFLVSSVNEGIVANYTKALKGINTDYFKILAGDDFLFKNNIFNAYKDANTIFSPLIFIDDNNNVIQLKERLLDRMARFGNDSERMKEFIIHQYRYGGGIYAPGVFMKKEVVDDGLYEALKPYKFIEDAPEWYYILKRDVTRVRVCTEPLVVYRVGTGISHNTNEEYNKDMARLRKNIHIRAPKGCKYLSPYFYMKLLDRDIMSLPALIRKNGRNTIRALSSGRKEGTKTAEDYINMIIDKSNTFNRANI